MNGRARSALLGLLIAAGGVVVWQLATIDGERNRGGADADAGTISATETASGATIVPDSQTPAERSGTAEAATTRSAVAQSGTWIDVGPGVGGGTFHVTWNVFDNDVTGSFYTRNDNLVLYQLADRTDRILANASVGAAQRGVVSLSDPGGPAIDGAAFPSGIWVTHPLTEARYLGLAPGERPAHVLEPAEEVAPAWIRVVDGMGAPVVGARVRQQALPPHDAPTIVADIRVRARRALVREMRTDVDGQAPRLSLGGPARVDVTDGTRVGFAVVDDDRSDIEVVLADVWRAHGVVLGDSHVGEWATVVVLAVDRSGRRRSVASSVVEGRRWGPLEIPHDVAAASYDFELRYGAVQPAIRTIPPPDPGEDVRVDFEGTAGHTGWIKVVDDATDEPIFGALVELRWQSPASSKSLHVRGGTGETGWAAFEGLPAQIDGWTVRADGYGTTDGAALVMAVEQPVYEIRLAKAGRIEGTIDFDGEPPSDFVVMHDIEGAAPLRASRWFRGPTSGTFVIDDAAPGTRILHVRVGRRSTPLTRVVVEAGRTAHVALQLLPTTSIRGRVVDAVDGAPVPDASIAIGLAGGDLREASTLSDGWRTDSSGAFSIPDVPLTEAVLRVTADRHAPFRSELGPLDANGVVDVGIVPLRPRLSVRARLHGDIQDPVAYRAGLQDRPATYRNFEANRQTVLDGAVMGENTVLIHPSGHEDLHLRSVANESTREVAMYAWSGETVIEFVDAAGSPVEFGGTLNLAWTDPSGTAIVRLHEFSPTHRMTTAGLPPTRVGYAARNVGSTMAASGVLESDGRSPLTVRFSEERARVRIVDAAGAEVPNVFVLLDVTRDGELVSQQTDVTAEDGVATFADVGSGAVYVSAHAPDERRVVARRISIPHHGRPIDVTLDSDQSLAVRVITDGQSVANAGYRLLYPYGRQLVRHGSTDLNGGIRLERIGPEPLLLEVDVLGRWPVSRLLAPGPEHVVEAPPLVDWELRVVDANGAAVAGAEVELEHTTLRHYHRARGELGGSVRAWVEAGLYAQTPLVTDAVGRLRLQGLPKGMYRVRVSGGAERWTSGEMQVGGVAAVGTIVLP